MIGPRGDNAFKKMNINLFYINCSYFYGIHSITPTL